VGSDVCYAENEAARHEQADTSFIPFGSLHYHKQEQRMSYFYSQAQTKVGWLYNHFISLTMPHVVK
jgi:hypothetical protein